MPTGMLDGTNLAGQHSEHDEHPVGISTTCGQRIAVFSDAVEEVDLALGGTASQSTTGNFGAGPMPASRAIDELTWTCRQR